MELSQVWKALLKNKNLQYKVDIIQYLDIMQKGGVLLQANTEWFLEKRPLKKALKYLKAEKISCLGSDAHNLLTRPPRFKEALINVQNKIGDDKFKAIELTTKKLLSKAKK